jgi:hypothetical protein
MIGVSRNDDVPTYDRNDASSSPRWYFTRRNRPKSINNLVCSLNYALLAVERFPWILLSALLLASSFFIFI